MNGQDRAYVKSDDGKPTVVSSKTGNFAARLARKHRIASLADAKEVGLVPAFVKLDALQREAERVQDDRSFDVEAERLVDAETAAARASAQGLAATEKYRRVRMATTAKRLRAVQLADSIEPQLAIRMRRELAIRAIEILNRPY